MQHAVVGCTHLRHLLLAKRGRGLSRIHAHVRNNMRHDHVINLVTFD